MDRGIIVDGRGGQCPTPHDVVGPQSGCLGVGMTPFITTSSDNTFGVRRVNGNFAKTC